MDLFAAIDARHSYRGPYLPEPVPREDLARIMEAGLAAPSGCNKQTTSLVAIDNPALLAQVRACINPPLKRENAPAAICVLTQRVNAYRDKCFATQDYAAAIENMLLAIVALGYASCWYEGHITDDDRLCDQMAAVLGVPDGYDLVCYLPVGRPDRTVHGVNKKAFDQRAWFNGFGGDGATSGGGAAGGGCSMADRAGGTGSTGGGVQASSDATSPTNEA